MEHAPVTKYPNLVLVFILGFAGSVFFSSFVFVSPFVALLVFVVGIGILLAEKIQNKVVAREVFLLALLLIALSLGSLRYAVKDFHEVLIPTETGVAVSEPEDKDNVRRFVFRSDNDEKVLVSAPLYHPVQYGDVVKVTGKLERPGIIESEDGGRDFDYGKYLAKDDIYYTLGFAEVEIISSGHGNPVKEALFKIKRNFVEQAKSILAEPYASLLMGLIVAGRDALPKDILEEFRRAGMIHIVVLSGFNITLIAEFLRRVFQASFLKLGWVRYPHAPAMASIIGVSLFVVMTGGEATVVRAALMAMTVIAAGLFGRNYSASRALLFAGFLMLLHNPKILVFDPSFQLSFLATLGLIYIMPIVKQYLPYETLAQTISTQLAVLPLLVYSMGDVSLVSLPANMLILLTVPWTMFLGFIAVLLSYISVVLAWPLTFVTHLLLSWILVVSHFFSSLPFATVKLL
ncbi:MAG: ComEC/Rec2 family competence protein [Patescibacteria group bacterium]